MAGPLADFGVIIGLVQHLPAGEGHVQELQRVHVPGMRRPAGAVGHLPRRVAVQEQQAAGADRPRDPIEQPGPLGRRGELDEDRHDRIDGIALPRPVLDARLVESHRHAARLRQRPRLGERIGRGVEGGHAVALRGQPRGVAPLAIGHAQQARALRQTPGLRDEKGRRLRPEQVVLARIALVPHALHPLSPAVRIFVRKFDAIFRTKDRQRLVTLCSHTRCGVVSRHRQQEQ